MNNAMRLLTRLDQLLDSELDLTIYGRAALQLGFKDPKPEYARSLDVDVVLQFGQSDRLLEKGNFWTALEQVNREFEQDGLYMSHIFEEDQVIISPDWHERRVPIPAGFKKLVLSRLSDADMMSSKLMRYDPVDLSDLRYIIEKSAMTPRAVADAIAKVRLPESSDIREQFALCTEWLTREGLCTEIY